MTAGSSTLLVMRSTDGLYQRPLKSFFCGTVWASVLLSAPAAKAATIASRSNAARLTPYALWRRLRGSIDLALHFVHGLARELLDAAEAGPGRRALQVTAGVDREAAEGRRRQAAVCLL